MAATSLRKQLPRSQKMSVGSNVSELTGKVVVPAQVDSSASPKQNLEVIDNQLKAVYYTVLVHYFNLQEKTTSTVKVTTNCKKLKAHFEKKLLHY